MRPNRRSWRITWVLHDVIMGLHSRIPLCCIVAFIRLEKPDADWWRVWGHEYAPCARCFREVRAGLRSPAVVHLCDARATALCRFTMASTVRWAVSELAWSRGGRMRRALGV